MGAGEHGGRRAGRKKKTGEMKEMRVETRLGRAARWVWTGLECRQE